MIFKRLFAALLLINAYASHAQDEEENASELSSIVVTGTRISAGGAQDINHFRDIAIEQGEMPRPESLTVEGLLSQHDLNLPLSRPCAQILCLATEAMGKGLPTRPEDLLFVGLGFTSNVDAATWQREPLNLVAVVDKSGSMDGEPLALVRQSLAHIVRQMRDQDRISIVLYGDTSHVYLPPSNIGEQRASILKAIKRIESAGSTDMESGLRVGFATALDDAPKFNGNTRVMLFTDEQPNVGATDAESFMGMAKSASEAGVGMTTIGVGVQFDGALAARVGSVRGGNLFFVSDVQSVSKLFKEELNTMVSEVAHDIRIEMTPVDGYRISGIFGVPDAMMEQGRDGTVSILVPTAFFSTQAGGIFLSLGKASARTNLPAASLPQDRPLVHLSLAYVSALDGKRAADRLSVASPSGVPSVPLQQAFALVDQYLVMRDAAIAFHRDGKAKEAFRLLSGLRTRLQGLGNPAMKPEVELVTAMADKAALMSGYVGEASPELRAQALHGSWEVRRAYGNANLARGDALQFDDDNSVYIVRRNGEVEDSEVFAFDGSQLTLPESELVMQVRQQGEGLRLHAVKGGPMRIELKRAIY